MKLRITKGQVEGKDIINHRIVKFTINVKAEFTDNETAQIDHYRLREWVMTTYKDRKGEEQKLYVFHYTGSGLDLHTDRFLEIQELEAKIIQSFHSLKGLLSEMANYKGESEIEF